MEYKYLENLVIHQSIISNATTILRRNLCSKVDFEHFEVDSKVLIENK